MEKNIRDYLNEYIEVKRLPGLAVGIVQDGKVYITEGFGYRDPHHRLPVSSRSLFHMASVSKTFVATGIMRLVEGGNIDLDAPVVQYLPYFQISDERCKTLTIRQFLSHTSGMPDVEDYEWGNPYTEEDALEKYVRSLGELKLLFEPGSDVSYSNIAYEVLGDVIAKVSGKSFEDYMQSNIFAPLKMSESTFLRSEVPEHLQMTPILQGLEGQITSKYPYNRAHAPSSTLHSNAANMCRFMHAHLNHGELDGYRLLQPGTYDLMWKSVTKMGKGEAIGLCWFLGQHRGFDTIGHGGSDTGFRSQLLMMPQKSLGVTVMSNLLPAALDYLAKDLLDILLGFEPIKPLPSALLAVSDVYLEKGFEKAITCLFDMRSLTPLEYDFGADQFLMQASMLIGSQDKALQALDVVNMGLALNPQSGRLTAALAMGYFLSGDPGKAQEFVKKALELDPEDILVNMFLKRFLSR